MVKNIRSKEKRNTYIKQAVACKVNQKEIIALGIALITFTVVISFKQILGGNLLYIGTAIAYAALVIGINVVAKKTAAYSLDADVEHDVWYGSRYGLKPDAHFSKAIPLGVMVPLVIMVVSLGIGKCMTFLTYETSALKQRAAKRFGFYSFTEMTDWHNALVGAAGIVGVLALAIVAYLIPSLEGLPSIAIYYAFWNMIPWSKLDGAQIAMGSRILYTALALITLVFLTATFVIS